MMKKSAEDKIPLLQRFALGTGHMLNVLVGGGMWFPYGIAFLKQVLRIPHENVGHIFIIAHVTGTLFTPLANWNVVGPILM